MSILNSCYERPGRQSCLRSRLLERRYDKFPGKQKSPGYPVTSAKRKSVRLLPPRLVLSRNAFQNTKLFHVVGGPEVGCRMLHIQSICGMPASKLPSSPVLEFLEFGRRKNVAVFWQGTVPRHLSNMHPERILRFHHALATVRQRDMPVRPRVLSHDVSMQVKGKHPYMLSNPYNIHEGTLKLTACADLLSQFRNR